MALPPLGVSAVVENAAKFIADITRMNTAVDNSGQQMQKTATQSGVLTRAYDQVGAAAGKMSGAVGAAASGVVGFIGNMVSFIMSAIGAVISLLTVAFVAAIGAAVAALAGLFALAKNAGGFKDIQDAFMGLTDAAGLTASTLIGQLQTASLGTISRFELMRTVNESLIGTTKLLGTELGRRLPELMILAQRQADATGKDTLETFNTLVEGIRRGTSRSLISAGVLVDTAAAQKTYADSIGVAVESLNKEQQSVALLNAVMEQSGVSLADLGTATRDATEILAGIGTRFTDIGDSIGLALQPAFEGILTIVDTVVSGIQGFVENSLPYIQSIVGMIADALAPVLGVVTGFADQLSSPELAQRFFVGAANTFGAFVAGIQRAETIIIQIVTGIAQAIADLLLGNSPPPKGPLSQMTTGGENTMQAWLAGFIGGFDIDPVNKVAEQVTAMMGNIATASRGQVEARLKALDQAVLPFQNRLTIIKSTFDAITSAAKPALDAINRQMGIATQALLSGDEAAAASVRALDLQRDRIQAVLDAQQNVTDNAQIQLALVQAQQAQERALLTIRQQQLGPVKAATEAIKKSASPSPKGAAEPKPKEEKKPGGGGSKTEPGDSLGGLSTTPKPDAGAGMAQQQAGQLLNNAFQGALGDAPEGLAGAQEGLQTQLDRLGSISPSNNRVSKMFDSIIQTFKDLPSKLPDITADVTKWVNDFIVTPITTGTWDFTPLATSIGTSIDSALKSIGIDVTGIAATIKAQLNTIKIGDTDLGTLTTNIGTAISTALTGLSTSLETTLAPLAPVIERIKQAIGVDLKNLSDGIAGFVNNLKGADTSGLPGLLSGLEKAVGIIAGVAGSVVNGVIKGLGQALPPLGSALKGFIDMLSGLGSGNFEQFLKGLGDGLGNLALSIAQVPAGIVDGIASDLGKLVGIDVDKGLSAWGPALDNLGIIVGNTFTNIVTTIGNLPTSLANTIKIIGANIDKTVVQPFKAAVIDPIAGTFATLFGDARTPGSIMFFFWNLGPNIAKTITDSDLATAVSTAFTTGLNFLTGTGDGTLSAIIEGALAYFTAFPAQIGAALKTVGGFVYDNFVAPIIDMLNGVIDGFNTLRKNILMGLSQLATDAGNAFSAIPGFQDTLTKVAADLIAQAGQNPIAHIQKLDMSSGGGASFTGGATGGLFSGGVMKVGERGEEIIASASKMAVFPNSFVRSIDALSSVLGGRSAVPMASPSMVSNSSSSSTDRSLHATFNGGSGDQNTLRRLKMMGAFT